MQRVDLAVPQAILESLPAGSDDTEADMQQAVAGWQRRINNAIESATTEQDAVEYVTDAIQLMESRLDRYDEFVPELRAWGQSPIYAIAWRNLYADLIGQLYEYEDIATAVDRERNARLVEDGIRWSNAE